MKKILIAALLTAGTFGLANAQAKKMVTKPATSTHVTVSSKTQMAPVVKSTPAATTATTKTASKTVITSSHMKSDGTPDKRYKENKTTVKHVKKDGTPDMRYKTNKK